VPQTPGWGLEPDPARLRDHPFKPQPRSERGGALWS